MANPTSQPGSAGGNTVASILKRKIEAGVFDVFLCHNSVDKPQVKRIGEDLKQQGVMPWLDLWELRPGLPWQRLLERQIEKVKSAAVFVGAEGIGPWQQQELDAFLREFVKRESPVIPVLLPNAPSQPALPLFLKDMTWVDFRVSDPEPMKQLLWGITGIHHGSGSGASPPPQVPKRPFLPPPPPASYDLAGVLIGSWQVQITNPWGIVMQMSLQIFLDGVFRGQSATPLGMMMVEGQWQIASMNQLSLQGRQSLGWQVMPYLVIIQLTQIAPFRMTGTTNAGEQTVWEKAG